MSLRVMALEIALTTNRGLTPGEAFVRRFGPQTHRLVLGEALDGFAGIDAQLLGKIEPFALGLGESRQDREHRGELEHVRIEVHVAERGRARYQLLVDAGFVAEGERVGHLDDDHAVEQGLVLLLLQELVELGEIGVRQDRLVEMDQREARHLDVLFLRQGQQQVEEFALDLEDLDHLEQAAAGGVHGAGPRPGAGIAFIADFGDLGEID